MDRLHTVLFHKKLGSYRDKAHRIERLARWIATRAFERVDAAEHAALAARLAKADLTTDMVFEFPELQGRMGGIYAREEGLPEAVWKAIYKHYLPLAVEADAAPVAAQLGGAANHVFGQQEARRQLAIGTGRAHDDRERRPVDAHLHRLFHGHRVPRGRALTAADTDDLHRATARHGAFRHLVRL